MEKPIKSKRKRETTREKERERKIEIDKRIKRNSDIMKSRRVSLVMSASHIATQTEKIAAVDFAVSALRLPARLLSKRKKEEKEEEE
uniref:Uncharacterized protein n=1 Tax=Vespula pensylvanica TaxID=30213 RepID=A0A834K8D7_VESPE|nr:hypothetical protein H0235_015334 [Vespula pensylvanica]